MNMTLALLRRKRVWIGLAVASCLAVLISHLPIGDWIAIAHTWIAGQGVWAIPTFIAIYVVAAIFGLPNIVLILAAGTLFGLTQGVISASIADTLSIAACFMIGQSMGRRWITSVVGENSRFHKLDQAFSEKGWKIVLLTRLSPVLPSNILNYGFSVTRINFWEYLLFSWLGMLPVIFTYVYVGTFGASILASGQQTENIIFKALGLVATIGVMFYATKITASVLSLEQPETESNRAAAVSSRTDTSHRPSSQSNQPRSSRRNPSRHNIIAPVASSNPPFSHRSDRHRHTTVDAKNARARRQSAAPTRNFARPKVAAKR